MNSRNLKKLNKYKKKINIFKSLKFFSMLISIAFLILLGVSFFLKLGVNAVATSSAFEIKKPISFLLLGSDYRKEEVSYTQGARADSIIVVTLNPKNSRGNVELNAVSIPRDNIAAIPCGPQTDMYGKVNSTLNEGYTQNDDIQEGIDCTVKSVEDLLNIKIDYYMMATFDSVINLINAIDGIEIYSPYAFCEQNSKGEGYSSYIDTCAPGSIQIKEGLQTMDGETALAYARQRHGSSDYERNLRQQQVISETIKKVLKNPTKYGDNFISVFNEDFYTNIKTKDLMNYFNFATTLFNNISNNLASGVPVYIDYKVSPFENSQSNMKTGAVSTAKIDNTDIQSFSDFYQDTKNFEKYTLVKRYDITKEEVGVSSSLKQNDKLKPIGIEVSTYSLLSTAIGDPTKNSDTYIDYNTLYYTSNLLRTSLDQEVAEPTFNYNILNSYQLQEPLYNYSEYFAEGIDL